MKVINIGSNNIVVKDIRGNAITVNPYQIVEVSEKQAQRLAKVYKFKIVEDVKTETPKIEAKEEKIEVEKVKKAFGKKAKAEKEENK